MLLSVTVDLNLHSGPRVFGQSLKKVHTCSIVYLQHSRVSAGETRLSSFSPFEVWFAGWAFLLSPPPLRLWPIPAFGRAHLKRFPYRADPCCWLARWKRSASGLSYQWWHHCMTHRERTSCSTTLLLFFFFGFKQQPLHRLFLSPPFPLLFCGSEKEVWAHQWSTPSHSFDPLWMHSGLLPVTAFRVCLSLVQLQLWTLSPEPCTFEVSDELFFAFAPEK